MIPRLLLVANRFATGTGETSAEEIRHRTLAAVEAGVEWVQLRDHGATKEGVIEGARDFVDELRSARADVLISMNGYPELARTLDLGLHIGRLASAPEGNQATVPGAIQTASVHNHRELSLALTLDARAVIFSPVFPTASKPGHGGTGLEALSQICSAAAPIPVLALGGIRPDRARACVDAGAHGVAVISGILGSAVDDIPAIVDAFHEQIR